MFEVVIFVNCKKCGATLQNGSIYCSDCGSPVSSNANFLMVTTHTVPGYKIKQVFGLVTGFTPRTRGALGKFIAGFQSVFGGEVTAFTSEVEKARWEAISRAKSRAIELGVLTG